MQRDQPPMSPARRVGIVARQRLHKAAHLLDEICAWLDARHVGVVMETQTALLAASGRAFQTAAHDDLPAYVDLVLVLGGDGTLLAIADQIAAAGRRVPILGVNFGSLGFLTEVTLEELYPALESALAGTARLDERLMLACARHTREGVVERTVVLNDVVVTRGSVSRIIDLSVSVDGDFVARFRADGLILATPTGSTAYNLAAGGPIVNPQVEAVVLTPIAPHTLTNRPVVLPASAEITIQAIATETPQEIYATFDGQRNVALSDGDSIVVSRADVPLLLVRAATRNYFDVLRSKLKWAER